MRSMQLEIQLAGGVRVGRMGIGAMPWSDSRGFGYGSRLGLRQAREAFAACLGDGALPTLFDSAEMYGFGKSERILGELVRGAGRPTCVATKYAPWPWRVTRSSVVAALRRSLARLGLPCVDLYQIHFPPLVAPIPRILDGLADAAEAGLTRAVGVSNFSAKQLRQAHAWLARRNVVLASNQVEYSLVQRRPERDGVLDACGELGVVLIAYSPLGRGVLSGRYAADSRPADLRRRMPAFQASRLERMSPLLAALREIGAQHGARTPSQVALNWLARDPRVLPIPGAKTQRQARENLESVRFELSAGDAERIDVLSKAFR
jgi:aryl-alcohol dehydrogenase-like predicted oxidoreductase